MQNVPEEVSGFSLVYSKKKDRYYGSGNIQDWIDKQKTNGTLKDSKGEYECQCPYCLEAYHWDASYGESYTAPKLYISKKTLIGHCFRCDTVFYDKSARDHFRAPTYGQNDKEPEKIIKLTQTGNKDLDMFYLFDEDSKVGYEYLVRKRHRTMAKLYKLLKIRFFKGNPVIPFFIHGELVYWQVRYINPKEHDDKKYYMPSITKKPPYIIEHGRNKRFVICEGVFDAIACLLLYPDKTPFAVLGSSITDYQVGILRSFSPEDILIYMDKTTISKHIESKLKQEVQYCPISIQESDGQDPEEYYKTLLAEDI